MDFVFVSGSESKASEAEAILGRSIARVALNLPEIQAASLEDVAREKASAAFRELRRPVVVEDSGLEFAAWLGLPGPFTKWFEQAIGLEGLARALDGAATRRATAACVLSFHSARDRFSCAGRLAGSIAPLPRGSGGFGWDSIFEPEGEARTLAEMSSEEKNRISHRRRAWRELESRLNPA